MKRQFFAIALLFCTLLPQCHAQIRKVDVEEPQTIIEEDNTSLAFVDKSHYVSAALQLEEYLPLIEGKRVGVVGNQTSIVGNTHLVDTLLSLGIDVYKIYTPEHGFRGTADAGAKVNSGKDDKTGVPIISLYGKNKKPTSEMLQGIDIILFDLQDVGVRFYTYISTMSYVMEAAAENDIPVIVLDRPNPNGFYVDGPVLKAENKSFVGMHQVPVVYGLPVKPSPNLPNWESVYLYPTLCFFEGTNVSVGRGTETPFQIYGHPDMRGSYTFTPKSTSGASKPLLEGQRCRGENLVEYAYDYVHNENQLHLEWIIDAYLQLKDKGFFKDYFRLLSGDNQLQRDIENGKSADEIRASWNDGLDTFKAIRAKYLMY